MAAKCYRNITHSVKNSQYIDTIGRRSVKDDVPANRKAPHTRRQVRPQFTEFGAFRVELILASDVIKQTIGSAFVMAFRDHVSPDVDQVILGRRR